MSRFPVAIMVLCSLLTCSDVDNFTVEVSSQTMVPSATVLEQLLGEIDFAGFDNIMFDDTQEFQNEGVSKDQVDSVRLVSLRLTISDPPDDQFDFLDSIRFFVEAEGLPRVQIAELDPVPDGLGEIEIDVDSSVELQPYVVAPSMTLTTEVEGQRPANETTVDADAEFSVDANVGGTLGCSMSARLSGE
jgi:hypothetical protein